MSETNYDVLWTGGWDSTFRVLYLALVEKASVQPHYIIDVDRQSSLRELQAVSEIRQELAGLDKQAACRIKPLKITSIRDIPEDKEITAAFSRLRSKSWLGGQYDWLARYVKNNGLLGLELSVHVDDKAYNFLKGHVKLMSGSWVLREDTALLGPDKKTDLKIFSNFRFPLLECSKLEMRDLAKQYGYITALEKAWFCYHPVNGKPCGTCNPCIYTIEEGMSYRFPKSSLLRYRLRHATKALSIPYKASRKAMRLIMERV
jgi:hypothetical protein